MKELDTIRKVLEFYAQGDWNGDPAKKALTALSTIDPDAKPQEPSEDIDMSGVENHISYCWLKCAYVEDGGIHFDRESLAKIIIERDDAIRREAKSEAVRDFNHYWNIVFGWANDDGRAIQRLSVHQMRTLCERLESITKASILGTEPARKESE